MSCIYFFGNCRVTSVLRSDISKGIAVNRSTKWLTEFRPHDRCSSFGLDTVE